MPKRLELARVGSLLLASALTACLASTDDGKEKEQDKTDIQAEAITAAARNVRFGVAPQWYQNYAPPVAGPANVDVVVVGSWLNAEGFTDAHRKQVDEIRTHGKTPYFFGYMATSLTKKGLGSDRDCDGDPGAPLCQRGADYIRNNIDSQIVPAYRAAARNVGQSVGSTEALIHIEPDWYQFSEVNQSNAFSRDESSAYMNKILGAIREGCSTCKVVIDFSPWFGSSKTKWAKSASDFYADWDRSVAKYVGLTGKRFHFTTDKIDNYTYKEITSELGLPLVVVNAYTFGGGPIDVDTTWLNTANVATAVNMGVHMLILSQQGDVAGYDNFISQLRGGHQPPDPVLTPTPATPPANNDGKDNPGKDNPGKDNPAPTPGTDPAPNPNPGSGVTVTGGNVEASITPSSTWQTGYCNNVRLTNKGGGSVTWSARIPKQGTLYNSWSSSLRTEGNEWVFTGVDWNKTLAPGSTTDFGYCANK